ncbi:MAG: iron ABC transporter permease [Pseudomonadota bacterium]
MIRRLWIGALLLTSVLVFGVYLALGGRTVFPWDMATDPAGRFMVWEVRLPRALLAYLTGGILALSGAVFQAVLRNPLADPYIVGVSGGAALGATIALAAGLSAVPLALPFGLALGPVFLASFAGASVATFLLVLFASRRGGLRTTHLLLMGVVFNFFASAMIMVIKTLVSPTKAQEILFWLMGTVSHPPGPPSALILPGVLVLAGLALLWSRAQALNALSLGSRFAYDVGVDPVRLRRLAFLVGSALVAVAVSTTGFIGFVGLVVPHALRLGAGPDHRLLIPASFLGGGVFLLLADLLVRFTFPLFGTQLPVGALTALVGGPLFILLLSREGGS